MVRPRLVRAWPVSADRVALGFAAVVITLAAASSDEAAGGTQRDVDAFAVVLLVVAGATLLASRRFPGAVALAVLGLTFVWYGAGYTSGLINVAALIAFFGVGVSEGQRRKLAVAGFAVVALVVNITVFGDEGWRSALTAAGYVVMAMLFGELVRNRHLLVQRYAQRAQEAEAEAERRVVEERLRIARDLHDVLAHTVSVMTVQSEVAADAFDRDRDAARAALGTIRDAGREAMGEVRATVAVLRTGADPTDTTPAPRIDQVAEIAAAARERGLDVAVDVALSGRPLPDVVELTAFRVVQEGITNVVRHARASSARIAIREEPSAVLVEVRDNGRPGNGPVTAGFGLRGMAERVESIGGELWHGRDTDGSWVVRASLPLPAATR